MCWLAYVPPSLSLRSASYEQTACIRHAYLCFVGCDHRARLSIIRRKHWHGHCTRWMYIGWVQGSVECGEHQFCVYSY